MRTPLWIPLFPRLLAGLLVAVASCAAADNEASVLTAVFAKTDPSYRREKDADGKWKREYYTMVNGGTVEGTIRDNDQDKVKFVAVATVLAQHLARQGYYPATDSNKVDFLLVVNWGRTMPFNDTTYRDGVDNTLASMNKFGLKRQSAALARASRPSQAPAEVNLTGSVDDMEAEAAASYLQNDMIIQDMMNRSRNQANARTAHLLGYMNDINKADGPQRYAGAGDHFDDLIADVEEARYYIILSSYDFQSTVREKKPKLRWITRMSMRAPGNSFAEKAAAMIAYSASRFGQNTDGLERKLYPQYKVNLADTRFLGVASEPKPAEKPAPKDGK